MYIVRAWGGCPLGGVGRSSEAAMGASSLCDAILSDVVERLLTVAADDIKHRCLEALDAVSSEAALICGAVEE